MEILPLSISHITHLCSQFNYVFALLMSISMPCFKSINFYQNSLKLSYFCKKKIQNFRALLALLSDPQAFGGFVLHPLNSGDFALHPQTLETFSGIQGLGTPPPDRRNSPCPPPLQISCNAPASKECICLLSSNV